MVENISKKILSPSPGHLYATKVAKAGHYLIKTRQHCLGSLKLNLGL